MNRYFYKSFLLERRNLQEIYGRCVSIDFLSSFPGNFIGQKWYAELIDLLKSMLDFSMFFELHFLLMSLATILLFTWFIVPYFYLAEYMTRNGYTESDAANLLSIIGITNTIGMVISNFTLTIFYSFISITIAFFF